MFVCGGCTTVLIAVAADDERLQEIVIGVDADVAAETEAAERAICRSVIFSSGNETEVKPRYREECIQRGLVLERTC